MSIYGRLLLWFCAANLVTLAASILIAHAIFERTVDRPPNVEALVAEIRQAVNDGSQPAAQGRDNGRRWFLVRNGASLSGEPLSPMLKRHLDELTAEDTELRLPRGLWVVSRSIQMPQGPAYLIVTQFPPRRPAWARWLPVALQILLSISAIACVGWVVARHLVRPLERIQDIVRKVAAGELSSRVGEPVTARDDEYGRLARDFDRMAAQIETLVLSRDRLLHDVSHELRAPLSRLRFALELAREDRAPDSLDRADREIARIDALVGELLALARLDQAASAEALPLLDVETLVREVVEAERPHAAHQGVELDVSGEPLHAPAERESLARALDNLVRNAVRHSPRGSTVEIRLQRENDHAVLRVSDRGPGVDADEIGRMFEPFFRGRAAQGSDGHGLGLAIVARVLRAHRGTAEARPREGGGLEVIMRWPLSSPRL
ncbi:MAG: sensor histidine kinase [Panacagrimonas sp.]